MSRIDIFKKHLDEKRAIKVIAGIDNHDLELARKVVYAAEQANASAVDVSFDKDIIAMAKEVTQLPVFVSSINPVELKEAVDFGADAIEIGNFDTLYKKGTRISAKEVLRIAEETFKLLGNTKTFVCATVPGHLNITERIELAIRLEEMGVDLIQTEGAATTKSTKPGTRGLLEIAEVSIANTIELTRNVSIPVMTASGISSISAPMAFAAGASAIGVGSCINKCGNLLAMMAAARSVVESVNKISSDRKLSV